MFWTEPAKDMHANSPNSTKNIPTQTQPLIDPKEQSRRLGCSLRHLQNLKNRRMVPYIKLGRLVRYNPDAVQRAIEKLTIKEVI